MSIYVDRDLKRLLKEIKNCKDICSFNREKILEHSTEQSVNGMADASRVYYLWMLRDLSRRIKKPFPEMTKQDLMAYFDSIKDRYAASTLWHYKASVKTFFKWLNGNGHYPENVAWIKKQMQLKNREELELKEILTPAEVKSIVLAANHTRDKALIFCLFESGCRAGEFLNLRIGDVRIDDRMATFTVKGKIGKRTCYLINSVLVLKEWLEAHPFADDPNALLWVSVSKSKFGKPLTKVGATCILQKAAERAGVKKRVWLHGLRHARATNIAKQGVTESVMRKMFGWSKQSRMPSKYIHLVDSDVKNILLELNGELPKEEKDTSLKPIYCPRCGKRNPSTSRYCNCGSALNIESAIKVEEVRELPDKLMETLLQDKDVKELIMEKIMELNLVQ
jgi:integrase